MKKIILTILPLLLIVGCSKKEPLNFELLGKKTNGLYVLKSTNEIYSGPVVLLYDDGEKNMEGTLKDGEKDGKWTDWHENGQKKSESIYKQGLEIKKKTYLREIVEIKTERVRLGND
jgi:antitoxin component YwqK of YwqJK toxin-antitoxin module